MAYVILISSAAERQIARLPRDIEPRVRSAIDGLAEDPRPTGSLKMQGIDRYRIRIGDYRVIYEVEDRELRVLVVRAGHRSSIY